jgi:transcriptional regulator
MSFAPRSERDLVKLVDEFPLAWVVSFSNDSGFNATPLPMLAETDAAGDIAVLVGHFALSNPQVQALRAMPRARILFMGPQGYITPEWISQPKWAPTWNYATAQFDVDIEFRPEDNGDALQRLVHKMEAGRRTPWTVEQMGERYESMAGRIIAFRAHVRSRSGRFKLGQDESRKSFSEIVAHLEDEPLRRWMKEFSL